MTDAESVPQIAPPDAAAKVAGGALLLDVREDDEWAAGHAPDAQHLPLGRLGTELATLDTQRPIVAVCRSGGRSQQAAAALASAGYDVANLEGGMKGWAAAGLDVVDATGGPGQVI